MCSKCVIHTITPLFPSLSHAITSFTEDADLQISTTQLPFP